VNRETAEVASCSILTEAIRNFVLPDKQIRPLAQATERQSARF
jgi:hypothetical protein